MTIREEVNEMIEIFVKEYGTDEVRTEDEIRELIGKKYTIKKSSFYLTDYCYNYYNNGLEKDFARRDRLFQKLNTGEYRILGANYPYNGEVYHTPRNKHEKQTKYIIGEWVDGVFHKYSNLNADAIYEYNKEAIKEAESLDKEISELHLEGAMREQVTKVRVNQSEFRKYLLARYSKCCLCGVSNTQLLIASHIKPWAESEPAEKLDVNNGLLLCPNHDSLFDKGLISFEDDGKIIMSENLSETDKFFLNVNENMKLNVREENKPYLKYHRNKYFT